MKSKRIIEYLKGMKLQSSLIIASGIFLGLALAQDSIFIPLPKFIILYVIFGVGCSGGAQILNRIFDLKIDKIEHPERGLPKKILTKQDMLKFAVFLLFIPFLSIFINWKIFVLVLIGLIFGILYSENKFKLGRKWYTSYFLLSFGYILIPILAGWLIIKDLNFFILKIAFFFTLIALPITSLRDISDMKGDRKYGKASLPVKIGIKNTILFSPMFSFIIFLIFLVGFKFYLLRNFFKYLATIIILFIPLSFYILKNPKRKINFTILEVFGFLCEILFVWWLIW